MDALFGVIVVVMLWLLANEGMVEMFVALLVLCGVLVVRCL